MSTSYCPVLLQLFDNYSYALAGGYIETYAAGTTTPLATYTDLDGEVPNENPVILDSAGRADIRLTDGVAYKYIVYDADGTIITTQDDISVGIAETASDSQYQISATYVGTPGAQGFMGGHTVTTAITFPINFSGAFGRVLTSPGSDFVISVLVNGVEKGTITINSSGTFAFATTGGTTVPCVAGDDVWFTGPASVGTAADFMFTLLADLA